MIINDFYFFDYWIAHKHVSSYQKLVKVNTNGVYVSLLFSRLGGKNEEEMLARALLGQTFH